MPYLYHVITSLLRLRGVVKSPENFRTFRKLSRDFRCCSKLVHLKKRPRSILCIRIYSIHEFTQTIPCTSVDLFHRLCLSYELQSIKHIMHVLL